MHIAVMAPIFISIIQIDKVIASTTFVEVKKEAIARRILQVCQLLTPPGTCLIDKVSLLNAIWMQCYLSYKTSARGGAKSFEY